MSYSGGQGESEAEKAKRAAEAARAKGEAERKKREEEEAKKKSTETPPVPPPGTPPKGDGVNPHPGRFQDPQASSGTWYSEEDGQGNPSGYASLNGKKYKRVGSWWIDAGLADKYGDDSDAAQVGRLEYSDMVNKQAQQRQQIATDAKTTATGYDSVAERQLRSQRSSAIGVNYKSDENQDDPTFVARQVLAEELDHGGMIPMGDGTYFSMHSPGLSGTEFKNSQGATIPGSDAMLARAIELQHAEDARLGGTSIPTGPQAPLTGPNTSPNIFNGIKDPRTMPRDNPADMPRQPNLFQNQPMQKAPSMTPVGSMQSGIQPTGMFSGIQPQQATPSIVSGVGMFGSSNVNSNPNPNPIATPPQSNSQHLFDSQGLQSNPNSANIFSSIRRRGYPPVY